MHASGGGRLNVYVIVSYPNGSGLSYAAFEQALRGFQEAGHTLRVTNLYEEGFDPVLSFDDTRRRHDLRLDETTRVYRETLLWADHVVFVFPIWWGGMPAILKGFIDRVFAKGFAYTYAGLRPVGLLTHKTAWIITTNDTPRLYAALFQQDYGRVLKRQVLKFCGITTLRHTSMYCVRTSDAAQRITWLESIRRIARNQLGSQDGGSPAAA